MLNVETVDDPVLPDETPNFAGGLASYPPRGQLAPNQFYRGVNTMISKAGVLQTRRGFSYLGGAAPGGAFTSCFSLGYLDTATGVRKLLAFFGGSPASVKQFDGTTWSSAPGFTPVAGYLNCIVQGNDKLYVASHVDNMRSWDGTTFVDLGSAATDAPRCKYIVWGTNRLIAAGLNGLPDTVRFSDILDPSAGHWPANNSLRVGAGDGAPITGLAMWTKTILAVFKRSRIYLVDIDPSRTVAQFTIDEVPGSIGCVEHRTITQVGRDLWFLANDGVRTLSRVLQGEDAQVNLPLSLPIHDQLRFYQPVSGSYDEEYARAFFFRGRFFLASYSKYSGALDGTWSDGSALSVFNVNHAVWEGRWPVFTLAAVVTNFAGKTRLVLSHGQDVCYWRSEDGAAEVADDYEDDNYAGPSQPIPTVIGTRAHAFGADRNDKQPFVAEVEFDTDNTADTATVKCIPDDGAAVTLTTTLTPSGKRPLTLLHQPPCRQLALELRSTEKKLAVRAVRLAAFANTMPVGS
jgi:hypothetical protein